MLNNDDKEFIDTLLSEMFISADGGSNVVDNVAAVATLLEDTLGPIRDALTRIADALEARHGNFR